MKTELVMELRDVFGGDGETRIEKLNVVKLKRTKKKSETRADIGLSVNDRETEEENTEEIEHAIQTFRRDTDGCPLMRLGGPHGKLFGVMKEGALTLRMLGVAPFKTGYKNILRSVIINPVWVRLENATNIQLQSLPQILGGFNKSMIIQKFDVIEKCSVKMELLYPDPMHDAVEKMINSISTMAMLNKRRATCTNMTMKIVDSGKKASGDGFL